MIKYKTRTGRILTISLTMLIIITFGITIKFQRAKRFLSEEIFGFDKELGIVVLLPNIKNAKLVIPGRSHPQPFLHDSPEYRRKITKRITCFCSTNSKGLRSKEFLVEKNEKTFRIICIGDSTTFGLGVSDKDTYPARLEEKLLTKPGDRRFEVINAGIPAHSSKDSLIFLERRLLNYSPGLIIVSLGLNDDIGMPGHSDPEDSRTFLEERAYQLALRQYEDNLSQIISLARKSHAEVLFLTPPAASFFPFSDISRFCNSMRKVAEENGVGIIDLKSIFEEKEKEEGLILVQEGEKQKVLFKGKVLKEVFYSDEKNSQYISPEIYQYLDTHDINQLLLIDGAHPNELGCQLIAKEIYQYLKSQNIVK